MQIINPRATFHDHQGDPVSLAPIPELAGKTVALLDNEKINARQLLEALGRRLVEEFDVADVPMWFKRPPVPAPERLLNEIASAADMTIIGSAD